MFACLQIRVHPYISTCVQNNIYCLQKTYTTSGCLQKCLQNFIKISFCTYIELNTIF